MSDQDAQAQVAASVARRGYRAGWTAAQFLARQVAKLMEELGEVAECLDPTDPGAWLLFDAIAAMGVRAGRIFDKPWPWASTVVVDLTSLKAELADIQVVLFAVSHAIEEIGEDPFDVVDAAVAKAAADEQRVQRGQGGGNGSAHGGGVGAGGRMFQSRFWSANRETKFASIAGSSLTSEPKPV